MTAKDIYSIKFNNVVGKEMSLDEFKGKKILVVNVASYWLHSSVQGLANIARQI